MNKIKPLTSKDQTYDKINEIIKVLNEMNEISPEVKRVLKRKGIKSKDL